MYQKNLLDKIHGIEIGEGYAVPDDPIYEIYLQVRKHGLKLRENPSGDFFKNMNNAVVYETLVTIYYGKEKNSLIYRDYSDGINLLYIELYIDEMEKQILFQVNNF